MTANPKRIERYVTLEGRIPFNEWFDSPRDVRAKIKISTKLDRIELGNLGDCKSLGAGLWEIRINYGPGYRIYFGQIGSIVVILLCGGDKSNQQQDISQAKEYWKDYQRRQKNV